MMFQIKHKTIFCNKDLTQNNIYDRLSNIRFFTSTTSVLLPSRENSPGIENTEDLFHKDVNKCTVSELKDMASELLDISKDFGAAGIDLTDSEGRIGVFHRLNAVKLELTKVSQGNIIDAVSTQGASKENPVYIDKVQHNTAETAIAIEDSPEPSNKRTREEEDSHVNIGDTESTNKKFKQDSSDITGDTEFPDIFEGGGE